MTVMMDPMNRAIFLDVDGTFVNDRGVVPASARAAVTSARANGHLVFLCTGRSLAELWDDIMSVGFDGVIAAAGGYVAVGDQVLLQRHFAVEDVRRVVDFFGEHGVEYYLEANAGLFGSPGAKHRLRELLFGGVTDEDVLAELERGLGPFIDSLIEGEDVIRDDINKVSFLDSAVTLEAISAEFDGSLRVIPTTVPQFGPHSGEISLAGITKSTAIEALITYLDIAQADTIAFGDGHNDLDMLQYVAVGIAMGNAHPALQAVADGLTGTADEDGIATGFAELGLI